MTNPNPFPSRRLTAICLIAAGVLMVVGFAVTPWESEQTSRAYHDTLAANADQSQVAAVFLHFGYLLLVPAAFGIMSLLAPRGGWLLKIGGVISVFGMATLPGLLVTDSYDLAMAQELPRDVSVRVTDAAGELPLSMIMTLPAVLGVVLGMILLFVALWRAGEVAVWSPVLVAAGWIVSFASFGLVTIVIGGSVMLAGFVLAAIRLLAPERTRAPEVTADATAMP
ncbi:MAG TPA: hypothetical protein VMF31_07090 [Solirubrobacterales bacterium]|nr:hypothetical protein [Solirubrobacterales bacterium]